MGTRLCLLRNDLLHPNIPPQIRAYSAFLRERVRGSFWVSISPTFKEQLFGTKVFCTAFLCLLLRSAIFCRKEISTKSAHKLLVKLTIGPQMCEKSFLKDEKNLPKIDILILFTKQKNEK